MPNLPGAYLAGQTVPGVVDGTVISGAQFIAFGQNGQILIYDGDPATGNLIGAWSGMAGNDSEGNNYPLGLSLSGTGTVFSILGTGGQNVIVQVEAGLPYLGLQTGAAEEGQAGGMQSQITNPGSTEFLTTFVNGPEGSVHADRVWIDLNSQAKDGSTDAFGQLIFSNSGGSHIWLSWGASGVVVESPITGDPNSYQTERLTQGMSGNNPLTVNSTGGQQVFGTLGVGTGTYHLHGQLCISPNQAAGYPQFQIVGGSTVAGLRIIMNEITLGSPFQNDVSAWITGLGGTWTGTTFGANDRLYTFDGTVVVTTAGGLQMYAYTSNSSDTYVIYGYGSYWELNPIGS